MRPWRWKDLINKAVGSRIREAGKRDKQKLLALLDEFAATMPRVTLRYAIEKLDKKQKSFYMNAAKWKGIIPRGVFTDEGKPSYATQLKCYAKKITKKLQF